MTRKVFNNNIYCMGKKIGIKLADGSFYPIMEDGVPQKKLMELTTVQDNQTTASIDLYRSESGTMDDAEYVDTLELSELKPHPGGETNMSFIIQLDENNMLSAEVCDPESGKTSVTKADLVNFPAETRTASSDSTLSGISDVPVSAPKKSSLGVDSFDLSDFDLDEFASLGDSHVDVLLGKDDTLVPDDFEEPVAQEATESFDLPDFEEPVAQEETASFDLPDFEEPVAQEATSTFDLPDFEEPVAQEETESFDLPDFEEPVAQEETASFDLPDFEEPVAQEETESFDLPDFEEPVAQEETATFDLPDFEEPVAQEATSTFDLPDFNFGNNSTGFTAFDDHQEVDGEDAVYEDSLPDFSKFELPDFDVPPLRNDFSFGEESGLFTENDFKDPAFNMNEQTSPNPFDFSDLYDHKEDELKPQTERKSRGNVAVIICVICTLICVGILLFILFLLPSKLGTGFLLLGNDGATTENAAVEEPDETAAVEDVIVIVETPSVTPVQPSQATKKSDVVRYQVKWGDTLWDIAQSYYNNPWLYHRIASANKIKNPDYIMAGTILVIPPQ